MGSRSSAEPDQVDDEVVVLEREHGKLGEHFEGVENLLAIEFVDRGENPNDLQKNEIGDEVPDSDFELCHSAPGLADSELPGHQLTEYDFPAYHQVAGSKGLWKAPTRSWRVAFFLPFIAISPPSMTKLPRL